MHLVRSLHEGDFPLYIDALGQLVPWFFALDRVPYSRWLPVHIRDLVALEDKHPSEYARFLRGKFFVQQSTHAFSLVALDQSHEQTYEVVKCEGGAVGLTEKSLCLRSVGCWQALRYPEWCLSLKQL